MKKYLKIISLTICCLFSGITNIIMAQTCQPQDYTISLYKAHTYFLEAKELADLDNAKLWGVYMYGPMLFVDAETRFVVANEADDFGRLEKKGDVFIGQLKPEDMVANTSVQWSGKRWMMIMWNSLSEDKLKRTNLMMHELYHCIQTKIGLSGQGNNNGHLDEMQGRTWMKMEWNALEHAIFSNGEVRHQAIKDALSFRNYRQNLFPESKENECKLEMNEGLAEYTGFKLSLLKKEDQLNYFKTVLIDRKEAKSYMRSFAYISGPLYGYLLDAVSDSWRKELSQASDLGGLLKKQYAIELDENSHDALETVASKYNYENVLAFEQAREEKKLLQIQDLTEKLINQPVLKLDLKKMGIEFDPRNVRPLKEHGTVYHPIRVTDVWGILDVHDDALMNPDWTSISVSAENLIIKNNHVEGNGWFLDLKNGWEIVEGDRKGDFELSANDAVLYKEDKSKDYYTSLFKENPVLICPTDESLHYDFKPNSSIVLENFGIVYKAPINIGAAWGSLKITEGVTFIDLERSHFLISLPVSQEDRKITGNGWVLNLNEGWEIQDSGEQMKLMKK